MERPLPHEDVAHVPPAPPLQGPEPSPAPTDFVDVDDHDDVPLIILDRRRISPPSSAESREGGDAGKVRYANAIRITPYRRDVSVR